MVIGGFGIIQIGVSVQDIVEAIRMLSRSSTPYLTYDVNELMTFYAKTADWLTYTGPRGNVRAPYIIEADFRNTVTPENWGIATCGEPFEFPRELKAHKEKMVARFDAEKKLKKGNNPIPRVRRISQTESGELHLEVQKAWYFDQVGSNLTLDYPFDRALVTSGVECETAREWDLYNGGGPDLLPPLTSSRLANTIGVAVGVTAKDRFGQRQIIKRLRTGEVAVYQNQWHVPLSFALAWPQDRPFEPGDTMSLRNLISLDYGHELAEEWPGLERTDFEPQQPLAFCRDMVRGGKPQLFFEVRSRLSVDELRRVLRPDYFGEFTGRTAVVEDLEPELSPELLAFCLLAGMPSPV